MANFTLVFKDTTERVVEMLAKWYLEHEPQYHPKLKMTLEKIEADGSIEVHATRQTTV